MQTEEINLENSPSIKVKLPSGNSVIIREQNGEDEGVMSRPSPIPNATALDIFLQGLIISDSNLEGRRPLLNEVLAYPLKDKYYAVLKSRLFSLGHELHFEHDCSNPQCVHVHKLTSDLRCFDDDLENPGKDTFDEEGKVIEKSEYVITPYPSPGNQVTLVTRSGKTFRYSKMDSYAERIGYDATERDNNIIFTCRNLEQEKNGKWEKVMNFQFLSAKDMTDLRKSVKEQDSQFILAEKITCPKCGLKEVVTLQDTVGFFNPTEC